MNIREGRQKQYKNREGDKTEETLKYGEQTGLPEGGWAKWVRGLRNLLLKSLLHHVLTNLDVNYKK